jgi:FAD/FMN-containing dehydrogenase
LSITLRFVPSSNEPFLRYARDHNDPFAVVLYFNQKLNDINRKQVVGWTHRMIELVLRLGGTYYLPYQRYATRKQLIQAYPQIEQFFKLKQHYDPESLFENNWYNAYQRSEQTNTQKGNS